MKSTFCNFVLTLIFSLSYSVIYAQSYSIPVLTRQSQLDSFHIVYPNCKEIIGDVNIVGSDITNVKALSTVEAITGNFLLKDTRLDSFLCFSGLNKVKSFRIINNDQLSYINNLNALINIPDSLVVRDCPKLRSLDSWNTLEEVGWFTLSGNVSSMPELKGLQNLKRANSFFIDNTTGLKEIEFYNALTVNVIALENNVNLKSIHGFNNTQYTFPCRQVIGDLWNGTELLVNYNDSLAILDAFHNVQCVGSIYVVFNKQLDTLRICENTKYLGDLTMYENSNLRSYQAFNSVERLTVNGYYLFDSHEKISDLQIFKKLKYSPSFSISNMSIKSLNGSYGMLDSIYTNPDKGSLIIYANPFLTDISALENLKYVKEITIDKNKRLGECSIKSVCDHIDSGRTLNVNIDNYPGCRSIKQIKSKCVSHTNEDNVDLLHIFPNPTDGDINITISSYIPHQAKVLIYDGVGDLVMHQKIFYGQNKIELSDHPSGIYFYQIFENGMSISNGKLIKI